MKVSHGEKLPTRKPVGGLSRREISIALGVKLVTVDLWIKQGLPVHHARLTPGARPNVFILMTEAEAWFAQRGIVPKGRRDNATADAAKAMIGNLTEAERENADGDSTPPPDSHQQGQQDTRKGPDKALMNSMGILGALERLRVKEFNQSAMLLRKIREGKTPQHEIAAAEREHTRTVGLIRQMEFAALAYRQQEGNLVDFPSMANAWTRICVGIRNAMQGVPASLVQRAMHLLGNPDTGKTILFDLAMECVNNALTTIPNEIPRGSDNPSGRVFEADQADGD